MKLMQKHLRNMILGVGAFIIFIVATMLVLVTASRNIEFDFSVYQEQLEIYKNQDLNFEENKKAVKDYINFILQNETPEEINKSIYEVLPEVSTNISFVGSSDEQLREYALEVFSFGQEYFSGENVKMIGSVYAVEERVALFLEEPRSYLYFVVTENQESMVAVKVTPNANEINIEPIWDRGKASDSDFVVEETNRYRFIFTNQIFE